MLRRRPESGDLRTKLPTGARASVPWGPPRAVGPYSMPRGAALCRYLPRLVRKSATFLRPSGFFEPGGRRFDREADADGVFARNLVLSSHAFGSSCVSWRRLAVRKHCKYSLLQRLMPV